MSVKFVGIKNKREKMKEVHYKNERNMLDGLDAIANKRNIKILDIIVKYDEVD